MARGRPIGSKNGTGDTGTTYHRRRAAGLCGRCGQVPSEKYACDECLKRKYEKTIRTYEQERDSKLFSLYGLRLAEWERLFDSQGRKCAVCESDDHRGRGWHTDHDHATGAVRGVLCGMCNKGLGHFMDDPERLRKAADYLTRSKGVACAA